MPLCDTSIEDINYPCAVYALRRSGIKMSLADFYRAGQPFSLHLCKPGAVLVWIMSNVSEEYVPQKMEGRTPISTSLLYDRHFAVYEGDDMVSDTFVENDDSLVRIRVRKLSDLRPPDLIIPAKTEGTNND